MSINPPSKADYSGTFSRITAETLCALIDSHPNFAKLLVVDCRTAAEYDGGHIKGAERCHPFEKKDNVKNLYASAYAPETLFIFHCEFSAYRAPSAINMFLEEHSKAGKAEDDMHAFVLDGGFSQFWAPHKEYCDGKYVSESECLGLSW